NCDGAVTAGPECVVRAPGITVKQLHPHSVAKHVTESHTDALKIELRVPDFCIGQIWIKPILVLALIEDVELPFAFLLQLPDGRANLIGVPLIAFPGMTG